MLVRLIRVTISVILLAMLVACGGANGPASPSPVTTPSVGLSSTETLPHAPTVTHTLTPSSTSTTTPTRNLTPTPTATPTPTFTPTPTAAGRGCGQAGEAPGTAPAEPSQSTDVLLQLEWGAGSRWPVSYEGMTWDYGSEPFGRFPELTLLPDGSLFYLEGDIQAVHLTEAEVRDLIQSVMDLGMERLESYTDPCRPLADGTCQCVAEAASSTLKLRMPGGELREIINYADYASYPHALKAIRALLEKYRHPAAQHYVPERATLFIRPLVDAHNLGEQAWPLDPAWLRQPGATDGPCTQIVSGSDLQTLLDVTHKNVGMFYFGQGGQVYEVHVIPWLPGADYAALMKARSKLCSPPKAGDAAPTLAAPAPTSQILPPATLVGARTVVLLPKPAPTVRPGWTTYPARHGAVELAFDRAGHLWAATYGGLFQVDLASGTYARYTEDEGLPSHWVNSVVAAPDGSLWVGTSQGIAHRVGETWTNYTVTIGNQETSVCELRVVLDGQLWAEECRWYASKESGGGRVALYDGQAWRPAQPEDGPAPDFNATSHAPDGSVWAPRDRGVARLDGETWTEFVNPAWQTQVVGRAIATAPDGSVWVGTQSGGVARFDGQNWTTYTTDHGLPSDRADSIAVAPDGSVWAGTWDGLARFDGETWTSYATGGGLVGDSVRSIALGLNDTRWIVTHDGISRLVGRTWTSYLWAPGGVYGQPLGVAPDGTAWTLPGSDLRRVDGEFWPSSYPSPGEPQRVVPSQDGSLWIAGPGRLVHFEARAPSDPGRTSTGFSSTAYEADCLSGLAPTGLAPAPDGTLWIGTDSSGVVQFDPRAAARGEIGCTFHTGLGDETDDWVESIAAIAVAPSAEAVTGHMVWAATVAGLSRYDGQTWTLKADVGGCTYTHEVHALAVTPEGDLWVGVPCGLAHFDRRDWSVYTVADGLAGGVDALAVDLDGSLWVGTPTGAQHFRPGEALPPAGAGR